MLILRQKEYFWQAVLPAAASLITGSQANKNQQEQAEEMARQQKKMDQANLNIQKQNLEINKQLAKTANKTPESAAIALQQQKSYALTAETKQAIIGSALPTAATLITGTISNKTAKEDLVEKAKTNAAEIKIKQKEANTNQKLAESASKDPMAAAEALRGRRYSETAKEGIGFVKNLGKTLKGSNIGRKVVGTAATGALSVGAAYAVDKAIQRNAKKSDIEILKKDTKEEKEARKKGRRRRAIKLGTAATIIGGSTLAAKHGTFGPDIQKAANDNINKESIKKVASKVGGFAKEGIKSSFISTDEKTGKKTPNYFGIIATAAPLAIPIYNYTTSKKQLKEQIKQSEGEEEEKEYSEKPKKINKDLGNKIFMFYLKKKARGYDLPKEKKYTEIKKKRKRRIIIKPKINPDLGNKLFNSFLILKARGYSKVGDWFTDKADTIKSIAKNTKDDIVKTAKSFKKRPVTTILDIESKRMNNAGNLGGLTGTNSFGRRLRDSGKETGNKTSEKVGNFIINHPKTALAGSIAIGLATIKAGQAGAKKTRKFLEDHDKNAFAYEKSQGITVPKDSKENEDDN